MNPATIMMIMQIAGSLMQSGQQKQQPQENYPQIVPQPNQQNFMQPYQQPKRDFGIPMDLTMQPNQQPIDLTKMQPQESSGFDMNSIMSLMKLFSMFNKGNTIQGGVGGTNTGM